MELMFTLLYQTVSCKLKLLLKLPSLYDAKEQEQNPVVFLGLYCKIKNGKRCYKVMKETIHLNILHARGIHKSKSESQLLLWVEPYTNNFLDYLERLLWKGPSLPRSKRTLLPTQILRKIVRYTLQIISVEEFKKKIQTVHDLFVVVV